MSHDVEGTWQGTGRTIDCSLVLFRKKTPVFYIYSRKSIEQEELFSNLYF